MRVRVDLRRCQGHNRCYDIAPDLFDIDDFGFASARADGQVPVEREDDAHRAVASCPERAILIEDAGVSR